MFSDKMRKRGLFSLLALLGLGFSPGTAIAFQMEFYTYGGFAEVVSAFNKCALIFSSDAYKYLLPSVFCLSLAAGLGGAAIYKLQMAVRDESVYATKPEGIWSAIINALIGSALFIGLIVPKGTLHIYDPTENAYQAVGGIPIMAVAAAGGANALERTMVSIMETAGDPLAYSKQSGMKGIQVMNSLMARGDESPKNEGTLGPSLENYTSDCVVWELARTGTALTVDELKKGTLSLQSSFSKAINPASFTTIYSATGSPQGDVMSCTDAWAAIQTRVNNLAPGDLFSETKKRACGDAGYSVYDVDPAKSVAAYASCVTATDALIKAIDINWSLDKFMLEMFFSNRFWVGISKDNPAGFANSKTSVRAMSSLQEYLSTVAQKRGVVTAFAAALLPFFALLLPTKFWPKATSTIITAFLICPIWGMLDAMTTDFYLSRAIKTWSVFLVDNWGVDQLALWNGSSIKEMSNWGLYVAASFGIALTGARAIGGSMGSVVGGFGGVGAASAEGALDRGKTGAGAMNREAVATGAGTASATTMGVAGYSLAQAMPNYQGLNQADYLKGQTIGTWDGQNKALEAYGSEGVRSAHENKTHAEIVKGGAAMVPIEAVQALNGGTPMDAAKAIAGANVTFAGKDSRGGVATNTATVDPGDPSKANVVSKGAPTTTSDGTTFSTVSTANTANGSMNTQLSSHGNTASITRSRAGWSDGDIKSVEAGFQKLPANASSDQYKRFAQQHGLSGETQARDMHQSYMANSAQSSPSAVSAGLAASLRAAGPKRVSRIDQVSLGNAQDNGTVGIKKSETENVATEIAAKMDKNKLFSNTDGYLQSLNWTDAQIKSFKSSWKKQTGYDISEATAHREANSEGTTHSNEAGATASTGIRATIGAKTGIGTPSFLPARAEVSTSVEGHVAGELYAGSKVAKSQSTQKVVDKSVTGSVTDSSSQSQDRDLAKVMAMTISEAKDSKFAATLSEGFGLSESSKAAISDTREESAGAGTTTNLSTYMVNDLLANDSRFQSGDIEADTARAMRFLDGNSGEAKEYKEKARKKFVNEHEVAQKVDASVDRSADAFGIRDKHEKGPDKEKMDELNKKTKSLESKVPEVVGGPVGTGKHAGTAPSTPPPAEDTQRRQGKMTPKNEVPTSPENNIPLKIRILSNENDKTAAGMTSLPRLGSSLPSVPDTGAKINVPGQELFQPRTKPETSKTTMPPLSEWGGA